VGPKRVASESIQRGAFIEEVVDEESGGYACDTTVGVLEDWGVEVENGVGGMVLEDQVNGEEDGAGEETLEPVGEEMVNLLGVNVMGDQTIDNLGDLDDRMETHGLVEQLHRTSDPRSWDPDRVHIIQEEVTIGPSCSAPQREWVLTLVAEFADVFALTLSEVRPVKFIEHKIHVPQGVKLPLHHRAKPLTEGQRAWFHRRVDKLVEAGIIMPISFHDVKCVNAVVMADKKSGKKSRSMEELRILANVCGNRLSYLHVCFMDNFDMNGTF
jgi:hypothetical protein